MFVPFTGTRGRRGDEAAVVKGFKMTSPSWEASLTRARTRADAQYGDMARDGRMNPIQPVKGGPNAGERQHSGAAVGSPQPGGGGGGRGQGFFGQGEALQNPGMHILAYKPCNACLKKGHKTHGPGCEIVRGNSYVPLDRASPALTPDEHMWATQWRSNYGTKAVVEDPPGGGGGGRGKDFVRRGQ